MVEPLSEQDLQTLMECIRNLYTAADIGGFPLRVMACLARLIPADSYAYDEANPTKGRALAIMQPKELYPSGDKVSVFRCLLATHPIFQHWMNAGPKAGHAIGAVSISDLVQRDAWERVPIYAEFYRGEGVEDQLGLMIDFPKPIVVAVACNRGTWGFTPREKRLLNLLHPHIVQAYKNAEAITEIAERGECGAAVRRGALMFSREGQLQWSAGDARAWIQGYHLSHGKRAGKQLDVVGEIGNWVKRVAYEAGSQGSCQSIEPRVRRVRGGNGWLAMRLMEGAERNGVVIVLEEHQRQKESRHGAGESLAQIIPKRLQQVLQRLLTGMSAKQIARDLSLSVHTVREHIQRLYERYQVCSRGELLAKFMRGEHKK